MDTMKDTTMQPATDAVIDELRRLTQAATLGGWYVKRGNHIYGCKEVTDGEEKWHPVIACTDDDEVNVNFEANAAFIAAANPAAISELLDRLEAAEKERDQFKSDWLECLTLAEEAKPIIDRQRSEIDALRAKIEAMGRQEPSEQDASVRKAWARFSHELHRSPDAPYPGMADAFEQHFSQSFTDRDWRVESGVWAAAWKAAKRHGAKGEI